MASPFRFRCHETPLKRSEDVRAPLRISHPLDARVAALRAAVGCGRTYRRGAAWAWEAIRPSVWPATTALRASVAFEKVRMRHAKPYWMVSMLFCVPNMR